MRCFYSWQLDSPRATNKDFIFDALKTAAENISGEVDFDEADRSISPETIELDQDTKDVLGSPPIAQVILEKITNSDVIVLDVTLVATGREQKRHINSNVAIELGFALGQHGYSCLLKIMNTAYGGPEDLPFDLRDRRHPIQFNLPESVTKSERRSVKKALVQELEGVLRLYVKNKMPTTNRKKHIPREPTFCEAAYWELGEPLCEPDRIQGPFVCNSSKLIAVRTFPVNEKTNLSREDCNRHIRKFGPLFVEHGIYYRVNKWGAITFDTSHKSTQIISGTQLFKDREVWSFAAELIHYRPRTDGDDSPEWSLSEYTLMKYLPDGISNAVGLTNSIGVNSFRLEIIASNLTDVYLPPLNRFHGSATRLYDETIKVEFDSVVGIDANDIAFQFTKKVYAEAGIDIEK